ncbi:CPXV161 protein [Cowpox virus]|uniref:CPXV161 protein n=1 Tax=Cowpox virus TaxID=10243 RepID=A0A290G7U0_COWPX|nr:CPXV161 protein [Cowpox virus]ATB55426.1 CPXV161 protein [Cowpox virus]ATB55640.1 CPXV161 protein [Cowpox virus]ATB55855.1 CPXV161 protein [Cowpox virus]ATB56070.1 CPXV161 protein [Cowpox virus]
MSYINGEHYKFMERNCTNGSRC